MYFRHKIIYLTKTMKRKTITEYTVLHADKINYTKEYLKTQTNNKHIYIANLAAK